MEQRFSKRTTTSLLNHLCRYCEKTLAADHQLMKTLRHHESHTCLRKRKLLRQMQNPETRDNKIHDGGMQFILQTWSRTRLERKLSRFEKWENKDRTISIPTGRDSSAGWGSKRYMVKLLLRLRPQLAPPNSPESENQILSQSILRKIYKKRKKMKNETKSILEETSAIDKANFGGRNLRNPRPRNWKNRKHTLQRSCKRTAKEKPRRRRRRRRRKSRPSVRPSFIRSSFLHTMALNVLCHPHEW